MGLLTATERRGLVPASGADGSVAGLWQVLAAGAPNTPTAWLWLPATAP
ncbi:hypothetical protein GS497_26440 [Rhodococcus hoagii]|nr:hypothetical protein [Prescottella equi]